MDVAVASESGVEDSAEGGIAGTGEPRAAAISARSMRVDSWKSGSVPASVSKRLHSLSQTRTERDVCLVYDHPLHIL
jgi:hypothetical protein